MPVVILCGPRGGVISAGGGSESTEYDAMDALATDVYMDPERATDGDGTLGTPWRWQQMLAYNPGGAKHVVDLLPGDLSITLAGSKFPFLKPDFSGTVANPQIWRAQYKATNSATTSEQKTRILRAGGNGCFIGTQSTNHLWIDGIELPNWHGSVGAENFMVSGWSTTGLRLSRAVLDGESLGNVTDPSTNCGGVYFQEATDCKVTDCIIRNIGSTSGTQLWSGLEYYSCTNLQTYNNTVHSIRGFGMYEKGVIGVNYNIANRHHHNHIYSVPRYCVFQYLHSSGTVLADATWWYQNILRDAGVHCFFFHPLASAEHPTQSGFVAANNIMARAVEAGVATKYVSPGTAAYDALMAFRNNIIFDNDTAGVIVSDLNWANTLVNAADFERNRYHANGQIYNDTDGNRTFDQFNDLVGQNGAIEQAGSTGDPGFENAASNDWRLTSGSACRNAGTDYLNLLGGGTSAAINQGPYITSGMTDEIGCRTSL